jgi:8-hydroxy-5-deazaflavin:NADPH oxidoreductase
MTIGIIGSGLIGSTVAGLAIKARHKVVISNSRGPESLRDLVAELGPNARAGTPADSVAAGDLVVLAVPFRDREALFKSGLNWRGKIVIDAMNPYAPDFTIMELGGRGSAEIVAHDLPGARVVKAFNTLYHKTLGASARPKGSKERIVLPIASDDEQAKRVVAEFVDSIGYDPFDNGNLVNGRTQEPNTALYNKPLTLDQARALSTQT